MKQVAVGNTHALNSDPSIDIEQDNIKNQQHQNQHGSHRLASPQHRWEGQCAGQQTWF